MSAVIYTLKDSANKDVLMVTSKINQTWFAFIIIAFWSGWFSLAFCSNASDLIYALGLIQQPFTFHSGNYALVKQIIAIYHWPNSIALILFILNVLIQGIIAVLFIAAIISILCGCLKKSTLLWPLLLNIALWAAFMIMEEFFLAYSQEKVHLNFMILATISAMLVGMALGDSYLEKKHA
jgi:hypothetical protein